MFDYPVTLTPDRDTQDEALLHGIDGLELGVAKPKGTVSLRRDQTTLERWQVTAVREAMDELGRGEAGLLDHAEVAAWLNAWSCDAASVLGNTA